MRGMAEQFRAYTTRPEDTLSLPESTLGSLQSPLIQTLGTPTLASGLQGNTLHKQKQSLLLE